MRRRSPTLAAVLVAGLVLTACTGNGGDDEPDETEATDDEAAASGDGDLPGRSTVEVVAGPGSSREVVSVTQPIDVRPPPRSTSTVREAGESPTSTVEVEVGEVISSFAGESTPEGTLLTLEEPILFDYDSAQLRPSARAELELLVAVLEFYEDAPVQVIGHTDGRGSDSYNDGLSQERADAVVAALTDLGVDGGRLTAVGRGSREPVADEEQPDGSDDPDGRAQNRRVEILIEGVEPVS